MNTLRREWIKKAVIDSLENFATKRSDGQFEGMIAPSGELAWPIEQQKSVQIISFPYHQPLTAELSDKFHYIRAEFTEACLESFKSDRGKPMLAATNVLIRILKSKIILRLSDGKLFEQNVSLRDQFHQNFSEISPGVDISDKDLLESIKGLTKMEIGPYLLVEEVKFMTEDVPICGKPRAVTRLPEVEALLANIPLRTTVISAVSNSIKKDRSTAIDSSKRQTLSTDTGGSGKSDEDGDCSSQRVETCEDDRGSKGKVQHENSQDPQKLELSISTPAIELAKHSKRPGNSSDFDDLEFKQLGKPVATQLETATAHSTGSPVDESSQEIPWSLTQHPGNDGFIYPGPPSRPPPVASSDTVQQLDEVLGAENKREQKSSTYTTPESTSSGTSRGATPVKAGLAAISEIEPISPSSPKPSALAIVDMTNLSKVEVSSQQKSQFHEDPILPLHPGWKGTKFISNQDATVPIDQQKILDLPDSWFPTTASQQQKVVSGYDRVPQIQQVPKSYAPRIRMVPSVVIETNSSALSLSRLAESSDNESLVWSSSPVSPQETHHKLPASRGSDLPSKRSKIHPGRARLDSKESDTSSEGSDSATDGSPMTKTHTSNKHSGSGSSSGSEKRPRTRASNGIYKCRPSLDDDIVKAKANRKKKLRLPKPKSKRVARKSARPKSEDEDEDGEPSLPLTRDLSVEPPFPIIDPRGITDAQKYGILGAQKVGQWRARRYQEKLSAGNDESDDHSADWSGTRHSQDDEDGPEPETMEESENRAGEGQIASETLMNDIEKTVVVDGDTRTPIYEDIEKTPKKDDYKAIHAENQPVHNREQQQKEHGNTDTNVNTAFELAPATSNNIVLRDNTVTSRVNDDDDDDEIPLAPLIPLKARPVSDFIPQKSTSRSVDTSNMANDLTVEASSEETVHTREVRELKDCAPEPSLTITDHSVHIEKFPSTAPNPKEVVQVKRTPYGRVHSFAGFPSRRDEIDIGEEMVPATISHEQQSSQELPERQITSFVHNSSGSHTQSSAIDPSPRVGRQLSLPPPATQLSQEVVQIQRTPYNQGQSFASSPSRWDKLATQETTDEMVPRTRVSEHTSSQELPERQVTSFTHVLSPESSTQIQSDENHTDASRKVDALVKLPDVTRGEGNQREKTFSPPPQRKVKKTKCEVDFASQEIRDIPKDVPQLLASQRREFLEKSVANGSAPAIELGRKRKQQSTDIEEKNPTITTVESYMTGTSPTTVPGRSRPQVPHDVINLISSPVSSGPCRLGDDSSTRSDHKRPRELETHTSQNKKPRVSTDNVSTPQSATYRTLHSILQNQLSPSHPVSPTINRRRNVEALTKPPSEVIQIDTDSDGSAIGRKKDVPAQMVSITKSLRLKGKAVAKPSKPELYAGFRNRDIRVPGYEALTEERKRKLEEKRRVFFGTSRDLGSFIGNPAHEEKPPTKRITSAQNLWWKDENTPLKNYVKHYKSLKSVRQDQPTP
ncbi:hypothetical protein EDC01DRAFT_645167 [Geopyxis carbonaria]|nr:hypothetical protein EDC01DRAFT_645167 [Geopyxis carbonaria]